MSIKTWLKSLPAKFYGSHVEIGSEHVTRLSSGARFAPDAELELRILRAREALGGRPIRADRKLILENPDTFVRPIDYDEGLPNG